MDLSKLNIGILHSLIGKNDGVSIVIDQSIEAMNEYLGVRLDNIYLLSALAPARFKKTENDIFWHKNEDNKYILEHFEGTPPPGFWEFITEKVQACKKIIADFVEQNGIDLFIIHNACHPTNFIYSVAAGFYFDELKKKGRYLPRYLLWWHDSHFERKRFANPNPVIREFLNYLPGTYPNGIVFINSEQKALAKRVYDSSSLDPDYLKHFFKYKTALVPNTCDIPWDFHKAARKKKELLAPPDEPFNAAFFKDIGLQKEMDIRGYTADNTVFLLQHTRVVERKRIDYAIDFTFAFEDYLKKKGKNCLVVLIISGHSGDENDKHRTFLNSHFRKRTKEKPGADTHMLFAEERIFPEREVIVDKRYYRFRDVPGIIARYRGLGTFFSEIEGYGNNLLEMISMGLPVLLNEYPIYKKDIKKLNFKLPSVEDGVFTEELFKEAYDLVFDQDYRNAVVKHNLSILEKKLNHKVLSEKLEGVVRNIFRYV